MLDGFFGLVGSLSLAVGFVPGYSFGVGSVGVWVGHVGLFAVGEFAEVFVFGVDLGVAVDAEVGGEFGLGVFARFFGGDF